MESIIRDINLAESGERKIEWVKRNCDLLRMLEEEFSKTKPFAGKKVALSVHLEAKTAYLCKVLQAGGAEMYVTGSNPLSTQDDVAAGLAESIKYAVMVVSTIPILCVYPFIQRYFVKGVMIGAVKG